MTRKRISLFLAVVGLAALLLPVAFMTIGSVAAAPVDCRIEGAWISSFSGGPWSTPLIMQETITPQDPAGNKLTYVMRLVNPDVTFAMPEYVYVDYMTELIGEAVRTGPSTYDFSLIGYGVNIREGDRNEIQYIWTVTGAMECVDGEHKTDDVHVAVYDGAQDADSDGYPDEAEEPIFCTGPFTFGAGQRVPLMPRCQPSAPPEGE